MSRFFNAALLAATVLITGCAATVQQSANNDSKLVLPAAGSKKIVMLVQGSDVAARSSDWELLRTEWRRAMLSAASAAGLDFTYQEYAIRPGTGTGPGTAVVVKVNDYRYISPGARFGLGIFTGTAFIDADVQFVDLQTGRAAGSRKYATSSSAMQGVFSAMTDKQIQAICTQIVKDVTQR